MESTYRPIDAAFKASLLDRIAGHADGLTRGELRDLFPLNRHADLSMWLALLIDERKVVEVARTHGTEKSHLDHKRLVVLRERTGR